MYYGDINLNDTIDIKFCTVNTSGAPTTLAGSPAVAAYVDNGTTEITAGVTLTVDFDARTGLHHVRVVASGGNGFAAGTNVALVLTAGTVGGTSVVGYVVGSFSIEKRSALRPTTAGRTLDVSATGEADANVTQFGGAAGTFSGGRPEVNTTHAAGTAWNSGAIGAATLAADTLTAAKVAADVGTEIATAVWASGTRTLTALGFTLASTDLAADFLTAAKIAADVSAEIADAVWDEALAGHLSAGSTGLALSSASSAGDPWATALPGAYGAGTAGKIVGDNLNATVSSRSSHSAADVWAVGTRTLTALGFTLASTDLAADTLTAAKVAADVGTEIATAVWAAGTRTLTALGFTLAAGDLAADTITAAKLAADAVAEIQSGLATTANQSTIIGFIDTEVAAILAAVDTEVAAIKAKTDQLTFTTAARVDSQVFGLEAGAITAAAIAAAALTSAKFAAGAIDAAAIAADAITAAKIATGAIDADALAADAANEIADALLDRTAGVETNRTLRQALRLILAACVGKLSGAATTTVTIRDTNDGVNRVVATVDADGNRTSVTLDAS